MFADEDIARRQIQAGVQEKPRPAPPLQEWSPEVDRLARIEDRLAELITVTVRLAGQKASRPQPSPRPVSARQRLEKRIADAHMQKVVNQLVPKD